MILGKRLFHGTFQSFLVFFLLNFAYGQDLRYQNRGNYYEGLKEKLISGYYIALLSARAYSTEESTTIPEYLRIKFYLKDSTPVNLIVREIEDEKHYWLDQVSPATPWKAGLYNTFEWPTRAVVKYLNNIRSINDLGVVVRLKNQNPAPVEYIAPAILYHSTLPETIHKYVFLFKTNGYAKLTCSVMKDGEQHPLLQQTFKQPGGRPFPIVWESMNADEGMYEVSIDGQTVGSHEEFYKRVHFYHKSGVE